MSRSLPLVGRVSQRWTLGGFRPDQNRLVLPPVHRALDEPEREAGRQLKPVEHVQPPPLGDHFRRASGRRPRRRGVGRGDARDEGGLTISQNGSVFDAIHFGFPILDFGSGPGS